MKRYYTTAFNQAFRMCASKRILLLALLTLYGAIIVLPFYLLFQASLALAMLPFWLIAKARAAYELLVGTDE